MPCTQFELKKAGASTEVVEFAKPPSWGDLVHKIADLFHIPPLQVGLAFVDEDRNVAVLKNYAELQSFYESLDQSLGVVQFSVLDLDFANSSKCTFRCQSYRLLTRHNLISRNCFYMLYVSIAPRQRSFTAAELFHPCVPRRRNVRRNDWCHFGQRIAERPHPFFADVPWSSERRPEIHEASLQHSQPPFSLFQSPARVPRSPSPHGHSHLGVFRPSIYGQVILQGI